MKIVSNGYNQMRGSNAKQNPFY